MEAREEAGGWVRKQLHLYKWEVMIWVTVVEVMRSRWILNVF